MAAVGEMDGLGGEEVDVEFMDEGGGLEGVPAGLGVEVAGGELAHLAVGGEEDLLGGGGVAGLPLVEKVGEAGAESAGAVSWGVGHESDYRRGQVVKKFETFSR